MTLATAFVSELSMEGATTRRVLERVPEGSLNWRPHPKSMSLGQLALHVATLPRQLAEFVTVDALDFSVTGVPQVEATSRAALLESLDESVNRTRGYLETLSDERAMAPWVLKAGDQILFTAPRVGVIRSFLFNHWYHHRGQLVVYLRLLDVPVPSVYGPTADENPFGA